MNHTDLKQIRLRGRSILTSLLLMLLGVLSAADNPAVARAEETQLPVSTTVMIYMCGSDLESRFGAASRDITEMMNSGFDPDYTNVLIMAGGSKKWNTGFPPEVTTIVEVGRRGLRPVWRSEELLSMADGSTLSAFLDFCYDRYPADRYGLIVWDHGGGANEGACYDELFDWNTLSVQNLAYAVRDSGQNMQRRPGTGISGVLNWIGFDACLMAGTETAMTLSSHADYLIASQEQEPSCGWNYSFLNGLEYDADAGVTGKRIVDSFFASEEDGNVVLTMSCVELSKMREVRNAMEEYFDSRYPNLTEQSYPAFSHERTSATSFGRAEYNESADYDLVDLVSLVETDRGHGEAGDRLIQAVRDAVLYSRSNRDHVNGLSIYHPYYNTASYLKKWAARYDSSFSGMPSAYSLYIRRFGQILTGSELGDWAGLETERELLPNGDIAFTVQLSGEQREHFEHATLLVLKRIVASRKLLPSYFNVWESDYLQPDENGRITAIFPGKSIYVVDDETGERLAGPIDYRITEDGRLQICVCFYDENGILDRNVLNTMYFCSFPDTGNTLTVDSISAYNEVTHEYSSRTAVDEALIREKGYVFGMFYIYNRLPKQMGEEFLGYRDWSISGSDIVYDQIALSHSWHFEVQEEMEGKDVTFVSFQITNTQNRTHSSTLSAVWPEETRELRAEQKDNETPSDNPPAEILNMKARQYLDSRLITLELQLPYTEAELQGYTAEQLVLNGETILDGLYFSAYDGAPLVITLPSERIGGVEKLYSLSFQLEKSFADYSRQKLAPVTVSFPEPVTVREPGDRSAYAEWEEENLTWRVYAVEPDESTGECRITFDISNHGSEEAALTIRGIALERYLAPCSETIRIPAGTTFSTVKSLTLNRVSYDSSFDVRGVMDDPLGLLGITSIAQARIFYQPEGADSQLCAAFALPSAVPCPKKAQLPETLAQELEDADGIRVSLEILETYVDEETGLTNADFGIWLENNGQEERSVTLDCYRVNGNRAEKFREDENVNILLPPQTARFLFLKVETALPPDRLETASFQLYVPGLSEKTLVCQCIPPEGDH